MQVLARDGFTAAQVTALLVAPDLQVDYGADLLDASLNVVGDLTPDLAGGVVHHSLYANVHGTCELTVSRQLAWGRDNVRPFMLLSSGSAGVSNVKFFQGVYCLTTPDLRISETPQSFTVSGFDGLYRLQDFIGDSYSVAAGTNVLTEVRAVLASAGVTAPVLLDSTASASVLASDLARPLTSSESPTWLGVVNALLATISYRGIFCDENGAFRSEPYVNPSTRPVEWVFDVGSLVTGVVANERSLVADLWGLPNWWRFVQNGLTAAPVEGAGQYTVQNTVTGLSSQASVGRVVHAPPRFLDAVDQASLVAQGDVVVAEDQRVTEVITVKMSPFPILGHADVAQFVDPALGGSRRVQARSWSLNLDGSDNDVVWEVV